MTTAAGIATIALVTASCLFDGTSRTSGDVRGESAKRAKADIDQVAVADAHIQNDGSGTVKGGPPLIVTER